MKRIFAAAALFLAAALALDAQDEQHFRKVVDELSSSRFQGRGYVRDGVRKAGKYIAREFGKAGVDEVMLQPYTLDINTFPGKMKLEADGRKLTPGADFVMREYSPGFKGSGSLYRIDTLNYDADRIFEDLARPENAGCFVVCDFWFTYKHSKDFRRMESSDCANAGMIYTWDGPLKFYKAYGEKVVDKPVIWVGPDALRDARTIKGDIDHKFEKAYTCDNVIARVDGARHDSCFVFTAHYDHLGKLGRGLYYPGANDNASGTAGLITLAEYYSAHKPEFDIWFVAVSGEEANLRGSTYFVENPLFPLSSIKYLINLDMIGDNNPVQYCEVSGEGLAGFALFESINASCGYFKALQRGELAANSDHYPFAKKGVPCIFFENESGDAFPFYHTYLDNMETIRLSTYEPLMELIKEFIRKY